MNNYEEELNYALKVIEELRNCRFQFREEGNGKVKKYIFTVNSMEYSSEDYQFNLFNDFYYKNEVMIEEKPQEVKGDDVQPVEPTNGSAVRFVPKNLIKNFVCAFSNFIHDPYNYVSCGYILNCTHDLNKVLYRIRSHLKTLLKAKRFNTQMLYHLLTTNDYRQLFGLFLNKSAVEWIERGRMGYKSTYVYTVKYLKYYVSGEVRSRLRFSYKR